MSQGKCVPTRPYTTCQGWGIALGQCGTLEEAFSLTSESWARSHPSPLTATPTLQACPYPEPGDPALPLETQVLTLPPPLVPRTMVWAGTWQILLILS